MGGLRTKPSPITQQKYSPPLLRKTKEKNIVPSGGAGLSYIRRNQLPACPPGAVNFPKTGTGDHVKRFLDPRGESTPKLKYKKKKTRL